MSSQIILGILAALGGLCSGFFVLYVLKPKIQLSRMRRDLDEGLARLIQLQHAMLAVENPDPKDLAEVALLIKQGEDLMREVEELTRRVNSFGQAPPTASKSHEQYAPR